MFLTLQYGSESFINTVLNKVSSHRGPVKETSVETNASVSGFPLGSTPGAPTGTQAHLSRLSDICCPRVWGKISLLFIEIAPQGADPGDLLVSGIPYRRLPRVKWGPLCFCVVPWPLCQDLRKEGKEAPFLCLLQVQGSVGDYTI